MPYIKTLETLNAGPLAWIDTGLLPLGAAALLQKPLLGETFADTASAMAPVVSLPTVARTAVLTASEDCTLRNLLIPPVLRSDGNVAQYVVDPSFLTIIGKITVAGTGPDVGSLVDGFGVLGGIFSYQNILEAPWLNIRLAAGDTVSLTLYVLGGDQLPINFTATYDRGLDTSVTPTRFVGGTTVPVAALIADGSAAAAGKITVTASPLSDGDTIELSSAWASSTDGTGAGGTLSGSAGGGGSGTNSWDTDLTGLSTIRDAILAALSDGSNNWAEHYSFASSESPANSILCTRLLAGAVGNTDTFTETSAGLTLTPSTGVLANGASAPSSVTLEVPSVDLTVQRIILGSFGVSFVPNPILNATPPELTSVEVNSSPVASVAPIVFPTDSTTILAARVNFPVSAGDTIDLFVRGPFGPVSTLFTLVGVAS